MGFVFKILIITIIGCCYCSADTITKYGLLNSRNVGSIKEILQKLDLKTILHNSSVQISNSTRTCIAEFLKNESRINYLDASGKPPAGILSFNMLWLGDYQECIKIPNAHYCNIGKIKIAKFQQFLQLGVCVPNICTVVNVVEIFHKISDVLKAKNITLFTVEDNKAKIAQYSSDSVCYKKEKTYSTGAIVMMLISSIILLFCLVGTITDQGYYYYQKYRTTPYVLYVDDENEVLINEDEGNRTEDPTSMHEVKLEKANTVLQFLLCFSLIKNSKALFDTTVPSGAITSVNGIRTLSIMWVVLGHTLGFTMAVTRNVLDVLGWIPRFTMQGILNAMVSVDSFFVLSGLLVGYLSMKRYKVNGKLPLVRYYLHRYIRLTPSYAYLLFFYTYLHPILSDGPVWNTQAPGTLAIKNCISYWWTNLLYINNFYPKQIDMCFGWSWYLANDMQFYVISPIILYCMHRFKWIGVVVANGLLLLACFITNGVLIHTEKAAPVIFVDKVISLADPNSQVSKYMKYLYIKPYTRISPYIVGLVLGYILMKTKAFCGKQKYWFYGVGWLVAVGTGIAVVYGPYSETNYSWKEPSIIIYGVFFRFAWAVAVGWVIYACHQGYGGLVNDFLSWKAFIPLSRLTYATYLVHPMVIYLFFFSTRIGVEMTVLNLAFFFTAVITISFACAYIVAVCIEYPVFNLEKLVLKYK